MEGKARILTGTIKLKSAKELQQLIERASILTSQLKETLQQIEQFKLKT